MGRQPAPSTSPAQTPGASLASKAALPTPAASSASAPAWQKPPRSTLHLALSLRNAHISAPGRPPVENRWLLLRLLPHDWCHRNWRCRRRRPRKTAGLAALASMIALPIGGSHPLPNPKPALPHHRWQSLLRCNNNSLQLSLLRSARPQEKGGPPGTAWCPSRRHLRPNGLAATSANCPAKPASTASSASPAECAHAVPRPAGRAGNEQPDCCE